MFERFTDRARRVLVVAQEEARNLDYGFIGVEHILLGLLQCGGVAAKVLDHLGVHLEEVRVKVAGAVTTDGQGSGGRAKKLPFTPQAKKALEMSLRQALRLGHKYIGTEHLLLGVLLVVDEDSLVRQAVGVGADEVRTQVLEILRSANPNAASPQQRSPALGEAIQEAGRLAGSLPVTTGHLLVAMFADAASLAHKALALLGVTAESLEAELAHIPVAGTSDGPPRPRAVEIKLGQLTTTIDDPDLAAALGALTPEQLAAALRNAFGTEPGASASGAAS